MAKAVGDIGRPAPALERIAQAEPELGKIRDFCFCGGGHAGRRLWFEENGKERGRVLLVEVGDVAAGGGGEADGGVVSRVDVAAEAVAGTGAADGLGELDGAARIAAALDDVDAAARNARRGMAEQHVDALRDLCELLAEAVGREHERPVEEDRRPRRSPESDALDLAAAVDEDAHVRLEAPVGLGAGGFVEEPVVVAGDEDDGLARGVDPREGVHRAALDVAADADDVGLVDDRLRVGRGNVSVEVGEGCDFHLERPSAAGAVLRARAEGLGG